MRKGIRRKVKAAKQAARMALFAADYYRRHGKLPPAMSKAEAIRFRNRVLAEFARSKQSAG
jgi:hypothetical protein